MEVDHSSSGAQLALSASVQVTATCCPHLAMAHSQDFYLGSVFFSVVILSRSWNGSQWWGKQRIFLMGKVFSSLLAGVLISLQSLSVRCNVAGATCGQNHVRQFLHRFACKSRGHRVQEQPGLRVAATT